MKFIRYDKGPDTVIVGDVTYRRNVPQQVKNEDAERVLGSPAVLDGDGNEIEPANYDLVNEYGFAESSKEEFEANEKGEGA